MEEVTIKSKEGDMNINILFFFPLEDQSSSTQGFVILFLVHKNKKRFASPLKDRSVNSV
jgi:hypothetical protein